MKLKPEAFVWTCLIRNGEVEYEGVTINLITTFHLQDIRNTMDFWDLLRYFLIIFYIKVSLMVYDVISEHTLPFILKYIENILMNWVAPRQHITSWRDTLTPFSFFWNCVKMCNSWALWLAGNDYLNTARS